MANITPGSVDEIEMQAVSNSKVIVKTMKNNKAELLRLVRGGDMEFNRQLKYPNNAIKTSKYNVLTFLPLNLFEQFHRFANIYFLFLVILQAIPQVSSVNPIVTIIPLSVVLGLKAFKDLFDDIQRHRSDRKINNRKTHVLITKAGSELETTWQDLQVGQIVLLRNNEPVPADLLLLSSSDDNGLCFVETAELDGETNLKVRQALVDTQQILSENNCEKLFNFNGKIECEAPNNNLNRYEGRLDWRDKTYSLNNENILLRGCTLRNTNWAYGIVIFAGKDTKLMKNSGKAKMKKTRLDQVTNRFILCILGFLILLLIIVAINCFFFESGIGRSYVKQYSFLHPASRGNHAVLAILNMFSFLILLQTVIPISLYISIEIIRIVLSRSYISGDVDMYYEALDTPACARTTTLNEELGQIEYIFTDKTGTLTQNIMTFNKCSIGGHVYGDARPERSPQHSKRQAADNTRVDFSRHNLQYFEPTFQFYDWSLLEEVLRDSDQVHEFFTLLSLCHTVIVDAENYAEDGKLVYKAQSPDEAALVNAARNFGFVYKSRTPNSVTINILGADVTYELLCVLDFDNVRKRMSVIVRDCQTGRRQLLCKGADTLILGLLDAGHSSSTTIVERTKAHLTDFAVSGLRTLCLATKDIGDDEWAVWSEKYHKASTSLENREFLIGQCYLEMEQNLRLIGATAVEDKLQIGVPETIYNLAKAGIKIWVLTGDKQETAINIGYSCNMLNDTMEEFVIDAETLENVRYQLLTTQEKQQQQQQFIVDYDITAFGLIINGPSLTFALRPELEQLFLQVACACQTVICCRVTPLQKALVVSLVKRSKQTVTLAIGDGANDVSMIKTAHIGVGISGQEGMQAVLSSDFSFAQFRYLQKLLLVHGRWAYLRIAVFLRYFFYKNFTFTLCQLWFGIYSGWSANSLYDSWLIMCYNLIYTSTPIVAYGWYEQDVNCYYSQTYPQLYQPGLRNAFFNLRLFLITCLEGIYNSVVVFFTIRYGFADYNLPNGSNILSSQSAVGVAVGTIIVIVVTVRCLLEMSYITVGSFIAIMGISFVGLFAVQVAFAELLALANYQFDFYGIGYPVWSSPNFWLCAIVILFLCCFPVLAIRSFRQVFQLSLTDRVRVRQLVEQKLSDDYVQVSTAPNKKRAPASSLRRSRRTGGSGYAFSQQAGIGRLIESGILHEGSQRSKTASSKQTRHND